MRVIYPHRARASCEYSNPIILNELTIEVDEILKLIEEDNECLDYDKSWLKVFNSQGITGLIPSKCVQPILDNQMTEFVFIRRPTSQGIFGNSAWYFGNITRFETIILFNKFGVNGDYLVRDSDVREFFSFNLFFWFLGIVLLTRDRDKGRRSGMDRGRDINSCKGRVIPRLG